ncbi:helix-turn-helix transcriptional regulator [Streptosporangium sp. NPDC051022]|uniref:helix-turn-helix transcriptional regulator n=1 Tax=Streptosporangium sp. NPDC051022 TaxID=3155752 RepID=UPI003449C976
MKTTDRQKYDAALRAQQRARTQSPTPVPYRITTALDMRMLYGPEVDRALGVEEPAVDQWETGELVPTREQVEALAKLTDYPVEFFYRPVDPTDRGATGFLCSSSWPKGRRCERIELGPPPPAAPVIPLPGRGRPVWYCRIPSCRSPGPHSASTAQAAAAAWRRHYLCEHFQPPAPTPARPKGSR